MTGYKSDCKKDEAKRGLSDGERSVARQSHMQVVPIPEPRETPKVIAHCLAPNNLCFNDRT